MGRRFKPRAVLAESAGVSDVRLVSLRWAGACAGCGVALARGTRAWHAAGVPGVRCVGCGAGIGVALDTGVAGRGARAEYERRRAAREDRARAALGRLGVAIVRAVGDPQHVRAWRDGAAGEERAGAALARALRGSGVELLFDRRLPRSRANVDVLAVGPGGVTVIDVKNVRGDVRVRRRSGSLAVAGRDRTRFVDGVHRQVGVVSSVLDGAGLGSVDVVGALCFVNGIGWLGSQLWVRDVAAGSPRGVAELARRRGQLDGADVWAIVEVLAAALPAA